MRLFNRQKPSDVPEQLQPYYDAPNTGPRAWVNWAIRLATVLIIIVLVVLFVRWVWHQTHTTTPVTKSPSTSTQTQQTPNSTGGAATPGGSSGSSSGNGATSSTSTSTGATSTVVQPGNLTNSGPGDTVALFVATSVAGAVLYELRLRHKQVNS